MAGIYQYRPYFNSKRAVGRLREQVQNIRETQWNGRAEATYDKGPETDCGDEDADYFKAANLHIDFHALNDINEDITGWIYIPQTHIDYPVLQGETLEAYLTRSYDGSCDPLGSVFTYPTADFSRENHSILFGHRSFDGQMFGDLEQFAHRDYGAGRKVYLYTKDQCLEYEAFASYLCSPTDETFEQLSDLEDYFTVIEQNTKDNGWIAEVDRSSIDRVLTLVTCPPKASAQYRRVVQCICRR